MWNHALVGKLPIVGLQIRIGREHAVSQLDKRAARMGVQKDIPVKSRRPQQLEGDRRTSAEQIFEQLNVGRPGFDKRQQHSDVRSQPTLTGPVVSLAEPLYGSSGFGDKNNQRSQFVIIRLSESAAAIKFLA